ncbi:thymidylate kinase [Caldimonas brevitalea]|uniref:Thymidylate kinase n=2 Tax=Caldimonas brevitalea TaxID=413882 RepID=A0A0G3BC37_9BURK|nr:thymidylate kinase [Caldimonas brevitalea]
MVSSIGPVPPSNSVFSRLLPPHQAHHIPLEFTGSGSEYFRIWVVNLLLTLVTLGVYHPWAKVRRLRYFYGHTEVAGQGLDFHGEPKKMLRGMLLTGVLFAAYSHALEVSGIAALVAALLVAALTPLLLRGALQFRLANTSWRGLRFAFAGSPRSAYTALTPPLLLGLVPLGLGVYLSAPGQPAQPTSDVASIAMVLAYLVLGVSLPYFFWRLKKYQHDHYRLAQLQSELRVGVGPVYGVYLRAAGLLAVLPLTFAALVWLGGAAGAAGSAKWSVTLWAFAGMIFAFGGLYLYIVVLPYFQARQQNLVWTKTGNRYLRFRSDLSARAYILLQLKNYLLILCTAGLYWPWAAVANRRMRVAAVTLVSRIDLDELYLALKPRGGDAAAEMADDVFGFDLGL